MLRIGFSSIIVSLCQHLGLMVMICWRFSRWPFYSTAGRLLPVKQRDHSPRLKTAVPTGMPSEFYGGGRGIRTPEPLSGLTVFKTAGFNRSPIPPLRLISADPIIHPGCSNGLSFCELKADRPRRCKPSLRPIGRPRRSGPLVKHPPTILPKMLRRATSSFIRPAMFSASHPAYCLRNRLERVKMGSAVRTA